MIIPHFKNVLDAVGKRPELVSGQNITRHYAETFSRESALWFREISVAFDLGSSILMPEAKVDTVYGIGNRGKSLDVAVLDEREYLVLDISIKSFNFQDHRTGNYRKNYTGRFYELLGEGFDLCKSYKFATLVAVILLPIDALTDSTPSSFGHAVRQFSKIIKSSDNDIFGFDFVFIGVFDSKGEIFFFDSKYTPPAYGPPSSERQYDVNEIFNMISKHLDQKENKRKEDTIPIYEEYRFR